MLLNQHGAAALVGRHSPSSIRPITVAEEDSSRPKKSHGERPKASRSNSTVKSHSDPTIGLDRLDSVTPGADDLWLRLKNLQEGSQELILKARELEEEKHRAVQEENTRLKERIKTLEKEAAERSKNLTILSDKLMELGTNLAIQTRKSGALTQTIKMLEKKLARKNRNNESQNEPMRVQRRTSSIYSQEEGHSSSEDDDDGGGGLLDQIRHPPATDRPKPDSQSTQPEKHTQMSPTKNTSVTHRDISGVQALDSWNSLCWKIESFSKFLVGDYLKFMCFQPVPIRRAAMSMSALSATTKQVMNRFRVWSFDRSKSPHADTRWVSAGSGDGLMKAPDTNPQCERYEREWLQRISDSETAAGFPFFQAVTEAFRITCSADDWCILGMVLSYFAQAVLWSVIMDRGVFRTNGKTIIPKTVLPITVKSLSRRFITRLGDDLCIEAPYLTGLTTEIQGLASEVIRVGQDFHRLSDNWYCEYPRWRSEVVKFDKGTMEENILITSVLPEIGPDAVVSSVIRPGLVTISDGNKKTEAKCLVILDDSV